MDRQYLSDMAKTVHVKLPDNYGFLIIASSFGDSPDNRMVYTSNIERGDAIKLVKEWLFNAGEAETWMKHIK